MIFRSERGYFLSLLGMLLTVVIIGWLMTLAMKTYFGPRPGISKRVQEATGVASMPASPETPSPYKGIVDQARETTRALSTRMQETVDASSRSY